ncbi:hypothetical protein LTR56_010650 [Elasticomyces elasticus]|nr:hypothetical protein LTR56_010650 [Elasticomyces elasticus]KAK3655416.1 hypothetical protein LTR22_010301 [Elasticomyces elasticus]KAK4922150.1 hypothetical protein LTR49_010561 [Elasticomyces elasticus]KAK5751528.1 hypothetical protein LTS12_018370 [Elasticomyces elasticus]
MTSPDSSRPWQRTPNCPANFDIGALIFSRCATYTAAERDMMDLACELPKEQATITMARLATGSDKVSVEWLVTKPGTGVIVKAEKEVNGVSLTFWLHVQPRSSPKSPYRKLRFEGPVDDLIQYCLSTRSRIFDLERFRPNTLVPFARDAVDIDASGIPFRFSLFAALPQEIRTAILQFALQDLVILHVDTQVLQSPSPPTRMWILSPDMINHGALLHVSTSLRHQSMDAARLLAADRDTRRYVQVVDTTTFEHAETVMKDGIFGLPRTSHASKLDIVFKLIELNHYTVDTHKLVPPGYTVYLVVVNTESTFYTSHLSTLTGLGVKVFMTKPLDVRMTTNEDMLYDECVGFKQGRHDYHSLYYRSCVRRGCIASLIASVLDIDVAGPKAVRELLWIERAGFRLSISDNEAEVLNAMLPMSPLFPTA